MGKMYSGNNFKSPAWNDIKKSKNRMGEQRQWASMPDRYQAVSHNPSGASNTALRMQDVKMADDT